MKKHLTLIFFYSLLSITHAKSKDNNNLLFQLKTEHTQIKSDSINLLKQINLGEEYSKKKPQKSNYYFLLALDICLKNNSIKSNFWTKNLTYIYDSLGVLERKKGNYDAALMYYFKALKIKEQQKNSINIGRSFHNIAMVFNGQREYGKAVKYMRKALPLRFKYNDSISYGVSLNMYGYFKFKLTENDSALYYYQKAKRYFNLNRRVTDVNHNLTLFYIREGNYNRAIKIYNENLKLFKDLNLLNRISYTYKSISRVYRKDKKFLLAKSYLDSSKTLALKLENKKLLSTIYLDYTKIATTQNKYKDAFENYVTYRKYNDSVFNIKKAKDINTLELNYKFEKEKIKDSLLYVHQKEKLLQTAENQKSQKQLFVTLWLFTFLVLTTLVIIFFYKRKLNSEYAKKELLEKELLNEKLDVLRYKTEQLTVDNKMRLQFKVDLLAKIKHLKENAAINNIKKYQSLIIDLQSQINTEGRLDAISDNLVKIDSSFESKLHEKFPNLTKSEREICNLIRMNLSIKEIMNIRNSTLPSIKSSRYRIRKKMSIPKGVELESFINEI